MRLSRMFLASPVVLLAAASVLEGNRGARALAPALVVKTQNPDVLFNENLLRTFTFRNVGPFRTQARASAIAVPAPPAKDHLSTFYLATWTGGVFKTTN